MSAEALPLETEIVDGHPDSVDEDRSAVLMRRAVVLAGGKGTRLQPYTAVLPKPLLPVGDGPVLDIVLRQLRAAGFDHVTVATGHLAELIEVVVEQRNTHGLTISYLREEEPLGTVGALALMRDLDEPFLVMNGDVLTDLDYGRLFADHVASDAIATIATTTREVTITLGVIECLAGQDSDRLTGYVEKPRLTYDVSMGVYCFRPDVLRYIEPQVHLDLPDLVLRLIGHGETVRAWRSNAYWVDLGRREDYERAITEFDDMRERLLPNGRIGAPVHEPCPPAMDSASAARTRSWSVVSRQA
jgi:NDP-sugar pyrophosphorylase family protein